MDFDVTIWVLIGLGIVLLGGGLYFFLRSRKPVEEEPLYFRCPGCKRKLRYYSRQIGHKGQCNSCKEVFTFPLAR